GRITMHRLNRVEYNNTVRDLLLTTSRPADTFTIDNQNHGFDNIADALSLSDLQLGMYRDAAEALVTEALQPCNAAARARILVCDPAAGGDACVARALGAFARRAWRRPVTDDEVKSLTALATKAKADGPEAEIALAMQAILLSPRFIFRVELDPSPS